MHSLDDRLKSFEQETLQKMQIYNLIPGKVDKLKEEFEAQTKLLQHNKTIATVSNCVRLLHIKLGCRLCTEHLHLHPEQRNSLTHRTVEHLKGLCHRPLFRAR